MENQQKHTIDTLAQNFINSFKGLNLEHFRADLVNKSHREVIGLSDILAPKQKNTHQAIQPFTDHYPRAQSCNTSEMKTDDEDFNHKETVNWQSKLTQKEIESLFIEQDLVEKTEDRKSLIVLLTNVPQQLNYEGIIEYQLQEKRLINLQRVHFCFFNNQYSVLFFFQDENSKNILMEYYNKLSLKFEEFFGKDSKAKAVKIQSKEPLQQTSDQILIKHLLQINANDDLLYSNRFIGIVILNLPLDFNANELKELLENEKLFFWIDQCVNLSNQTLILLRVKCIETALNIVKFLKLQNLVLNRNKVEFFIHSKSFCKQEEGQNESETLKEYLKQIQSQQLEGIQVWEKQRKQSAQFSQEDRSLQGDINFDTESEQCFQQENPHFQNKRKNDFYIDRQRDNRNWQEQNGNFQSDQRYYRDRQYDNHSYSQWRQYEPKDRGYSRELYRRSYK